MRCAWQFFSVFIGLVLESLLEWLLFGISYVYEVIIRAVTVQHTSLVLLDQTNSRIVLAL